MVSNSERAGSINARSIVALIGNAISLNAVAAVCKATNKHNTAEYNYVLIHDRYSYSQVLL